jgi:hypothetical protein
MSETRRVRACPICSENNVAYAAECRICGEDLEGVTPGLVRLAERGPFLGAPERAIAGAGLAVSIAAILLRDTSVGSILVRILVQRTGTLDDELFHLTHLFQHPTVVLFMACGIIGAVLAALTAFSNGWTLREFALASTRRKPCPRCAEMIQSQAAICRYCSHPLEQSRTIRMIDGAPALR